MKRPSSRCASTGQSADKIGQNKEERPPNRLLTADEVAQRWQVPRAHVYRLGREERLPTVRLGRYMRWRVDALEAFERDGGASPNA